MAEAVPAPRQETAVRPGWDERGFSLVELVIVLSILTVLSTLALSGYAVFKIRAQEALLKNLAYLVKVETDGWVNDYGNDRRWGGNYDTDFLNGQLEKTLEGGAKQSIHGVRNPFSGSGAIVNWPDVLVAESNPAIQITNNADYSYAGMGADSVHPELRGSIVVYLDNGVPDVDIFYVDLLGKRSAMLLASKTEGGSAAPVTPVIPVTPVLTDKEKAKAAATEAARLKAEAAAQKKEVAAEKKAAAAEAAAQKKEVAAEKKEAAAEAAAQKKAAAAEAAAQKKAAAAAAAAKKK